ncbi:phage tail protein [Acinetobacter sp. WCHAc060033]|uniref:phage tail protein n=1 Tax=Acinetobacter sp. WCHAc060033 TaxID=2518624 RepID=UPI0010238546|nr:phage tail protein [Acinetobacter sp. WCHAc060033]RZG78572.1 phage tail protein [Acinetobacter sp. WCHAc060033]
MDGQIYGTSLTMMKLGTFRFCIYTAAYQELNRTTNYEWSEQAVFGDWDNLQYLGPGEDSKILTGVVYPEFKGGTGQIDDLRNLASEGVPHLLISGTGKILGYWVIKSIVEGQSFFAALGMPRRQEFTINMRKYSDKTGQLGLIASFTNAIGV